MTKFFVSPGDKLTMVAPAGGVTSGEGYVIGNQFVVAEDTQIATAEFTGIPVGVHLLTVDAADTAADGATAFWDNTGKEVKDTSASGLFQIGTFAEARAAGAGRVRVRLDGIGTIAVP